VVDENAGALIAHRLGGWCSGHLHDETGGPLDLIVQSAKHLQQYNYKDRHPGYPEDDITKHENLQCVAQA